MSGIFKKIYNAVSTAVIAIVVILAILLAGVRLIGLTPYTVLSGSMEPTYHVGSVVYVKKTDPAALKTGDPVTYTVGNDTIVTHRIIEVVRDGENTNALSFKTQGDANDTPDMAPVPSEKIIGKPVFSIPLLGFISHFIQTPQGLILTVGGCIILLLLSYIIDNLFPDKKDNKTGKE